jgi:chorismate mutase/prephenate dehydrogenase
LFVEKFNKVSEWFGPFGEQAMRESTFLINKLIERF